ncbi:MAG: L,D-transpeptidase family protein [Rhodospirillales bacterium]|nr:L,D-transpeptidase family protein [Rhodospirillales bacterium]
MNVPAAARLAQLRLNQQRIRDLLNQRMEDRYILVNVAGFQLEAVERHNVEQRHRVIAGKPERQTPTVRATIRALNFFPYWRVPDSIASLDLIPRLLKEPEYLAKEQIRVLTGSFNGPEIDASNIDWRQADATRIKFKQDPGPQNALGLVRIDMPNEHGVYMHDTPMKKLFDQRGRAFSAGCVRVQDVFGLVAWIARDEPSGVDRQRIEDILAAGQAVDITLTRPLPVYFTYLTAWVDADGRPEFRPDIYGRDGLRELSSDRERDPDGFGVIGVVHPWESGRDNSADWDDAMRRVQIAPDLGSYQRRDTAHIDAEQRPRQEQYDRFLTLVKFGREAAWNQETIARKGPFFVADPGVHFILMRADRDLLALAERFGRLDQAAEIQGWLELGRAGTDRIWNPEIRAFCARDLRTGDVADAITSASALVFYAGAGSSAQRAAMIDHLTRICARVGYAFPSLDPEHARFEPKRYWLGPVWMVLNYMIARGLAESGHAALAERIRMDSRRLIGESGFYEYFHPMTGEACGGGDFSWTAAMWLAWAGREEADAKAA